MSQNNFKIISNTGFLSQFESAAEQYNRGHGNEEQFLNTVLPIVYSFTMRYFTSDHDIAGDFLLHVYEKITYFLFRYQNSNSSNGFAPYFARCLRNCYYNFYRSQSSNPSPLYLDDADRLITAEQSFPYSIIPENEISPDFRTSYTERITNPDIKLLIKLRYGISLKSEDMQKLIEITGSGTKAASIVNAFKERTENLRKTQNYVFHQSSYLSYRINTSSNDDADRLKRKLGRILRKRKIGQPVMRITELSEIFSVGRSTISRRIEVARKIMLREMQDIHHMETPA